MIKPSQDSPPASSSAVAEQAAESVPQKDPLTGLYEQDYLTQTLERLLVENRARKIPATLGLLQLENFYEIRSWVGKSEANLLLSDIAGILAKTLPQKVLLCRCRHYEFGILLVNDCSINAQLITDRVKQALLSTVSASIPAQLELKCGVGLAVVESGIPSAEVLFARARQNLSLAHYQNDDETQSENTNPLVALKILQQTLRDTELKLCFQATVNLAEDGLRHYEIRCLFPKDSGTAANRALFETAASNALGEEIDRRVVTQALNLLKQGETHDLRLTITLTHNSLVSPRFLQWLETELATGRQFARQLVFQLSEIDVLIAQHHLGYFCEKLQQHNIKLCISHFGCTNDPFRYLSLLQAHFVKLDNSLFAKINVNARQYQQLTEVIARLHEYDLEVIAPMLEKMPLLPLLWQAKVNFVQGYRLHEPSPSMDFQFLKDETLTFQ